MKKKIKKAFTLVELLVVIAILAILATVSIVGYNSFTKKAKVSNDTALVSQLNTVLKADSMVNGNTSTPTDALKVTEEAGYDVEKLTPTASNYEIIWNQEVNQFALLDENDNVVYGEKNTDEYKNWKFVSEYTTASDYSVYLKGTSFTSVPTIHAGLDVGNNTGITTINYANNTKKENVVIRTNGGQLEVNAANDTVSHYGHASVVTINEVANKSYHEYGTIDEIKLNKGRIVVEKDATVGSVMVTASSIADINVENNGNVGGVAASNDNVATSLKANVKGVSDNKIATSKVDNSEFAGGLGTESAPYLIENGTQFANINNYAGEMKNGKSYFFKQISDIEVSTNYKAYGFAGGYDGSNFKIILKLTDGNYKSLFSVYRITGHVSFKNMNLVMSNVGVNLISTADWGTSFGADFENITFNSTEKLIKVNCTNFGLIVFDALYIVGENSPSYTFKNITNNVNVLNEGTCTGFIIGSGFDFTIKTSVLFENCINNGNITGTSSVGYLYGNSNNIGTVKETNSKIEVLNCKNNGTLRGISESSNSTPIVELAPKYPELNEKYQTIVGGSYTNENYLANAQVKINQNGNTFSINTNDGSLTYKLAFVVNSIYWTKDNHAWTDDDLSKFDDKVTWEVSNGKKYFIDLQFNSNVEESLTTTYTAYDKKTALKNGLKIDKFENGFSIIAKENATYIVFDVEDDTYINSNVSLSVYAYNTDQSLLGIKKIK